MNINFKVEVGPIEVRIHQPGADELKALIHHLEQIIMATKDEVLESLTGLVATVTKIGTETSASLAKIAELEALIAAGGVSQDIVDKVAELKSSLTAVDDLVADAPAPTP